MSSESVFYQVNVCLVVIHEPLVLLDSMIDSAVELFATAGLFVNIHSRHELPRPELSRPAIGKCEMGNITFEQKMLFEIRYNTKPDEIVVYFVDDTVPPSLGCASHPSGRPSVIITKRANRWTLAHEIGHLLGLRHVNDPDRLMSSIGTDRFGDRVPGLWDNEKAIVRYSKLVCRISR